MRKYDEVMVTACTSSFNILPTDLFLCLSLTHTHTHTHRDTRTHTDTHTQTHAHTQTDTHTHTHTYIYIYILYKFQNKEKLFPWIALCDWFLCERKFVYFAVRTESLSTIHVVGACWGSHVYSRLNTSLIYNNVRHFCAVCNFYFPCNILT